MKRMIAILLLLTLSLSMWGCSSNAINTNSTTKPSRPNSSTSSQQSSNKDNATAITIDPNGFSSLEQLVGAYVAMQTCSITKEQYRKCFPESYWRETDIDQQYSAMEDSKPHWQKVIQKYGDNFRVSYNIVAKEIAFDGSKSTYTTSENQKHISIYGVGIDKRTVYTVSISITLKGSAKEDSQNVGFSCAKIANKWYADDNMTN